MFHNFALSFSCFALFQFQFSYFSMYNHFDHYHFQLKYHIPLFFSFQF